MIAFVSLLIVYSNIDLTLINTIEINIGMISKNGAEV